MPHFKGLMYQLPYNLYSMKVSRYNCENGKGLLNAQAKLPHVTSMPER